MFRDRVDAGRQLAMRLAVYANRPDVLVLGIPRGGVPVAFEVSRAIGVPLDVVIVRKLGTPGQKELAMGAIASGGARILNQQVIAELDITEEQIANVTTTETAELRRRELLYRGVRPDISPRDRIVILVDDGIATGSSMLVAVSTLRTLAPKKIIVAIPVAPSYAEGRIAGVADEFVCVLQPECFFAIGEFYGSFPQIKDAEVRSLMQRAADPLATGAEPHKEKGAA
jgi:putative phosphoribosyl transferase